MIPKDNYPSATEAGVMNFIERNAPSGFGPAWPLLLSGLNDLDAEAGSRSGVGFALLGPDEQDRVLAAVEHGDVRTTWHVDPAGFFETLVSIAADGFYADPGNGANRGSISWSMVGYPAPLAPRSMGRLPAVVRSHHDVRDRYDVIVVGAGAGGGVAAYVLAGAGLEVLVVERGDALGTDKVPADHLRNHRLARWGHNTGPSLSGNPRVLVTDEGPQVLSPSDPGWNNVAMTLGGGTRVWGAQAWRMSPIDFHMATTYGVPDGSTLADWPISYEDLEPYYDRAEWALGVAGEPGHAHAGQRSRGYPLPPFPLGTTGHRLAEGAERLGWSTAAVPLMINTAPFGGRSACVRCSQCIGFACPVDAKTGAHNSVLADAAASGHCTVLVGTRVARVLTGSQGRATGVVLMAEDGVGSSREVRAGAVVLSAGAIETARLLLMSQLGGPLVGTSLQGHTYVGALGLFDEPVTDAAGPGPAIATCQFLHGNEGFVGGGMLADEFVMTPTSFWHTALPPTRPAGARRAKRRCGTVIAVPLTSWANPGTAQRRRSRPARSCCHRPLGPPGGPAVRSLSSRRLQGGELPCGARAGLDGGQRSGQGLVRAEPEVAPSPVCWSASGRDLSYGDRPVHVGLQPHSDVARLRQRRPRRWLRSRDQRRRKPNSDDHGLGLAQRRSIGEPSLSRAASKPMPEKPVAAEFERVPKSLPWDHFRHVGSPRS